MDEIKTVEATPEMDELRKRIENLERQIRGLLTTYGNDKVNNSNNMQATRQSVSNITPFTETKTGYYGESEKVFYDAPVGNTSVFFDNYSGSYSINRIANRLIVSFDTLKETTNITISIL